MFLNKKGIISLALTGCLLVTSEFGTLAANPQSEAQAIETISHQAQISPLASVWEELPALAEVAEDTLRNGDKVKEGEVVKYTINVTNNTNEITENIQLKANVPAGTVVVVPSKDYVYNSDPFYYEEKTDITTIDVIIPKLAVGETYTYEYEVRVNMDAVATVSQIANKATVKHNEFEVQTNEIANNLTENQKVAIIQNKLEYHFNEIMEANVFRFAKISNKEDIQNKYTYL